MRPNPLLNAFLFLLNLGAVLVGLYLAIDALDASRLQTARGDQTLNRLADAVDRLSSSLRRLEAGGAAALPASPANAAGEAAAAKPASGGFLDDDLRDPAAEEGGGVVSRTVSLPGNLNPMINNEATVSSIWNQLVDSLAGRNSNDLTRFEPLLAEAWEVSPDGLVYTIRLRDNIFWQAATDPATRREIPAKRVTAGDFLFYWNTLQNPAIPCEAIRNYYELLDRVEIVDDLVFRVIWKEPYSLGEEFTLGMQPLPEHYYRPDPAWSDERFAEEFISSPRNQWIVGTGPYKLIKWDKNSEVLLERDEDYYGPKPPIKSRRIRVIPDNSVSFLEFQKGGLDVYGLLPTPWHEETPAPDFQLVTPSIDGAHADSLAWDRKKRAGEAPPGYKFEKYQYNGVSWSYVGYNMQRPLFQDVRVRTALTLLTNRKRILDEVYMGLGKIISGPFVPQSPYYNHAVEPLPFDPARAGELLAEAGWTDSDGDGILDKDYAGSGKRQPFAFTFIIPASSTQNRKWAAIIEQDLIKAGVKADIKPIEWSVYTQVLEKRDYDVCSLAWTGGVEGDPYQIWHSSGANREGSSNHVAYASPEADRLIEEGRRTLDKDRRYAIYRRLHEVVARDQPYAFLAAGTAVMAQSKRIYNAIVYKSGQMNQLLEWIPENMQGGF
ncbi:MAG: ABC transporter substrate-binding protein [Planctomycetota bacterium]|jgi:ABC-type transport system substrate-binding protein|nr:ABC transporter substrate-binding protein [Planctomycetota bacterium]